MNKAPESVDEYLNGFEGEVLERLRAIRETVRAAAPDATEKISYAMPTLYLNGNLVHFAAFANHIGFYPAPSGVTGFEEELAPYVHAKGSVQFPHDQPLPLDLVRRITEFRAEENRKAGKKK